MAFMIPETPPSGITAGERILFNTLKNELPNDIIAYYEPRIGIHQPDYLLIVPEHGVLVLEVKDYTEKTLVELSTDTWRIRTSAGKLLNQPNPYSQAKNYAFKISDILVKDPELLQSRGRYAGRLKFPYSYAVVFTRMQEEQLYRTGVMEVMPNNCTFSRDEIDTDSEIFNADSFREKLWACFGGMFRSKLSTDDIDSIRYLLFPEIRLEQKREVKYVETDLLNMKKMKTMDLHQELLAKQLGDKHRLLRGVAGSGKTLILASRAKILLDKNKDWKLLVLCYGTPLSRQLSSMIDTRFEGHPELRKQVEVYNFHEWSSEVLKISNDAKLEDPWFLMGLQLPKYDAILIDEGQDFKESWLRTVVACLNEETQSLLLVEDKAQDIFRRKSSLVQATGLDFRGRSKILSINYRNTQQVLDFSWDFYKDNVGHSVVKDKLSDIIEIIPPIGAKRRGMEPVVRGFNHTKDELDWVVRSINKIISGGSIAYKDIAILYRAKWFKGKNYISMLKDKLKEYNIPYYWVTENKSSKKNYNADLESVKVCTLDSSKGLDFKLVFMIGMEMLPHPQEEDKIREAALGYIGMTRSINILCLTFSGDSEYVTWLKGRGVDSVMEARST